MCVVVAKLCAVYESLMSRGFRLDKTGWVLICFDCGMWL